MLAATSDLSHQKQPKVRFKVGARQKGVAQLAGPLIADHSEHYNRIARDPRYRHFARIPARIVRCLDHFQITCDRIAAARILSAYYIFIAVVDNAIDSGESQTATVVFEHLARFVPNRSELSDVALITENLKLQLDDKVGLPFRHQLGVLYETVRRERSAVSIEAYLEVRKAVGRLTADLGYLLISPLLEGEKKSLRTFMQQVGAVGCLVDSVIDLSSDQRRGLVSFIPTVRDYARLTLVALSEGLSVGAKHPRLAGLFALAVLDNVGDRFVAARQSISPRRDGQVAR